MAICFQGQGEASIVSVDSVGGDKKLNHREDPKAHTLNGDSVLDP
jgi:hypothetical protein